MEANQNLPVSPEPRKFSEEQRDRMLLQLLESSRSDMAQSISFRAEMLAMRTAILKLAGKQGLDRDKFADWLDELQKHFHHQFLTAIEDKDAWIASVLDERKDDEI